MVLVHFPRGLLLPLHQLSAIPRLPLHSGFEDGRKTHDRGCSLLFPDCVKAADTGFLNLLFGSSRKCVRDGASCKRTRESAAAALFPSGISSGSAIRRHEKPDGFINSSCPDMAATRQALKRSNFSFREDGSSNRRIPNLYAGSTTSQLPPFRKKDARNLAEACLSPDETENAGITKSPVLFIRRRGTHGIS